MKIFCIGLNKTGTRSLSDALEILGYRTLHWGGADASIALRRGPEIRVAVERALAEGRPLLEDVDDVDAYSDILALSTNFDVLDRQYPGSKFILTVRDLGEWLDSRRRHVETNIERQERGEYSGTFVVVDYPGWISERTEHERRVRAYFADRANELLVLDISAGEGWEALCPFLGVGIPDLPFPRRG
jgi:hypothetical protein